MSNLRIERSDIAGKFTVDDALSRFYDDLIRSAVADSGVGERHIREWIDDALISDNGFRNQTLNGPEPDGAQVLRCLQDGHLLRAESRRGAVWFELAHDRLVDPIRTSNEEWRSEHLSMLQIKAEEWDTAERPDGLLIGGPVLAQMARWATAHPDQLVPSDQAYLDACSDREARAAQLQRNSRRTKVLLAVATCLLVGAVSGLVFAIASRNEAANARTTAEAETARALAAEDETSVALVEAEDQRQRAEDEATRADAARNDADDARQAAESEAARALAAEDETALALADTASALETADEQRQLAQDETARAVAAEAATAGALAAAERQRALAEASAADTVRALKVASELLSAATQADQLATPIFGDGVTGFESNCSSLAGVTSSLSDPRVVWDLTLVNDTNGPVTIKWVSPSGNRLTWGVIGAGDSFTLLGISGWVWIFEDVNGDCLGGQQA